MGHLLVNGAAAGGGERDLTLGLAYAVTVAAVPTDLDYLALGTRPPAPAGAAGSGGGALRGQPAGARLLGGQPRQERRRRRDRGRRDRGARGAAVGRPPAGADPRPARGPAAAGRRPRGRLPLLRGRARPRGARPGARGARPAAGGAAGGAPLRRRARSDGAAPAGEGGEARSLPDHYADWHAASAGRSTRARPRPSPRPWRPPSPRPEGTFMRPLELRLSGFRSYDEQTVDWRPHGLVVIAGDTGAGKTSLLDAICFALYGRTPELSGPRGAAEPGPDARRGAADLLARRRGLARDAALRPRRPRAAAPAGAPRRRHRRRRRGHGRRERGLGAPRSSWSGCASRRSPAP